MKYLHSLLFTGMLGLALPGMAQEEPTVAPETVAAVETQQPETQAAADEITAETTPADVAPAAEEPTEATPADETPAAEEPTPAEPAVVDTASDEAEAAAEAEIEAMEAARVAAEAERLAAEAEAEAARQAAEGVQAAIAANDAAVTNKTELQLKEELINNSTLTPQGKLAARSMTYEFLKSYLRAPHNAYDGHSVLDHARMKVRFAPPFEGKKCPDCGLPARNMNPEGPFPAWSFHYTKSGEQYSRFPIPLSIYTPHEQGMTLWQKLCHRVQVDNFNLAASLIFLFAILHTFLAPKFQSLAHHLEKQHKQKLRDEKFRILHPEQRVPVSFASTLCHFLGEVEVVFGLWLIPFFFVCEHYYSMKDFLLYIDHDTSFTEPLFVAVVMVIASSRPIYRLAENTLKFGASLGHGTPAAWWISVLCIAPLLGSFITEPAAMTLAAILLGKKFYQLKPSVPLCYATIALLFVNVSVGGTLTHFAAPPIVMVAGKWDWDMAHMFMHFGWKAIVGIAISNFIYYRIFAKEFKRLEEVQRINSAFDGSVPTTWEDRQDVIPVWVYAASILFLAWTVYFAHHPAIFIGGFMFFLGFTMATPQYQNAFSIKVPMLVAFFLAGLLVMGGVQGWWMQPVLQALSELGVEATMGLASILTAFNDNASVTFLSSTVPNLAEEIRYAIVAGAVTGGGLTVIANAPNPAGQAILGKYFKSGISALKLFLWAAPPTVIMFCMFNFIR